MDKFLIKRPIISEKSTAAATIGKYTFLVDPKATAPEIKKVVEKVYNVHVIKTNVVNARPKPKRFGQHMTLRPGFKKITVTLAKGEKLDILPS